MGAAFLYGNGGGTNLPFRIFYGTTQPSNPKNYDIWIKTSVAVTQVDFVNASWSSAAVGRTIILGETAGGSPSTSNTLTFVVSDKSNGIPTYEKLNLTGCQQVQGSTGNWVNLNAYRYYGGTWVQFSNAFKATINVTYPAGSTCTATDGTTTLTAPDTSGSWACVVSNTGTWTVTCTDGSNTATESVSITEDGQSNTVSLAYVGLPMFTYTGSYKTVDDGNNNWRIRFLTSGKLTFSKLQGAGSGIDIFCVGGGGGGDSSGGCGGKTTTVRAKTVTVGTSYTVTVGAGGAAGKSGGNSSFGSLASAAGGGGPGGTGGSGGGGSGIYISSSTKANGGNGGSNGADGVNGYGTDGFKNGKGQGTTTKEFGSSSGTLYAGGGGGAGDYDCTSGKGGAGGGGAGGSNEDGHSKAGGAGTTNLGGGGGGGSTGGKGGSGIVIIRNKR